MRVHDSQASREMDLTRERISLILELRKMLPSFQIGFNLVSAAVVGAILESIPGFELSSLVTDKDCRKQCSYWSRAPSSSVTKTVG